MEPAANGTDTFLAVVRVLDANGTPALALALRCVYVRSCNIAELVKYASCLNSMAARDD